MSRITQKICISLTYLCSFVTITSWPPCSKFGKFCSNLSLYIYMGFVNWNSPRWKFSLEPKLKIKKQVPRGSSQQSALSFQASSSLRELWAGGDGEDCPQFGDALGSEDLRALAPRCLRAGGGGRLAMERAREHQVLHPISHCFLKEVLVEMLEQNIRWKGDAHISKS